MQTSEVKELINELKESEFIEVKNWLGGLSDNNEKARLAKEIIALANSGGGHIFIGFSDDKGNGHKPIEPEPKEEVAFSQDSVSSIVHRYCIPAIQCKVNFHCQADENIKHPVISVPASGHVPIYASRSSDKKILVDGTVYVRRPGGHSEPCRTQDDWERLLNRLVLSRQNEIIQAIRGVLNRDEDNLVSTHEEKLNTWIDISRKEREKLIGDLPSDSPLRFSDGNYEAAFVIAPFNQPDIRELQSHLDFNMPKYSGWPPFVFLHKPKMKPYPIGNIIQAWIVGEDIVNHSPDHADFWRISTQGEGYLLRAMQEDCDKYTSSVASGSSFDWILPIYRMIEIIKVIEWLGLNYSSADSNFQMRIIYTGMKDRTLTQHSYMYALETGAVAHDDIISSEISGSISEISLNMEEIIFTLLKSIFSQFDFAELPRVLVENIVREALSNRR